MQDGDEQSAWRELIALYSNTVKIIGGVGTAVGLLSWLLGLPSPFPLILGCVFGTLLFLGMLGRVFVSNSRPLESLSEHLHSITTPKQGGGAIRSADSASQIGEARNEHTSAITDALQPSPNIVFIGEDDLFVELDRHEIFRESENYDYALRAVTVKFCNEPNPPHKITGVSNVEAQILYYSLRFHGKLEHRVHHACWLGEESPYVSFGINTVHHLIIGTFEQPTKGGFGQFMTYDNHPDRNKALSRLGYSNWDGFRIKVRLIAGEHGEFGSEHEFELKIQSGAFTFEQITGKQTNKQTERASSGLQPATPKPEDYTKVSNPTSAQQRIDDLRARDIESQRDFEAQRQSIIDEGRVRTEIDDAKDKLAGIYALQGNRLRERKRIADEIKSAQDEGTQEAERRIRKAERIKALSDFAKEGQLLLSEGTGTNPDRLKANDWAARAESYIREEIGEDSAAWFSLATTEGWPGGAVDRGHVDWIHTRIKRLGELASEVRTH